jgi:hypothetical protein
MASKVFRNLYPGINPHCNSQLQTPGNATLLNQWPSFHSDHITHITDALNERLLPQGYYAASESSLQLRLVYLASGIEDDVRKRQPDLAILGTPGAKLVEAGQLTRQPSLILELDEPEDDPTDYYMAVAIRTVTGDELVTRVELLSPGNMPGHSGYGHYDYNRTEALRQGIALVELDYLHEFRPVQPGIPVYPRQEGSFAYGLYISYPHRPPERGRTLMYGFQTVAPFPIIDIPLKGSESIEFDFGAVYQITFRRGGWAIRSGFVDYTEKPIRFETYSPADQARILQRMAAIAAAVAHGDDLEAWQGGSAV